MWQGQEIRIAFWWEKHLKSGQMENLDGDFGEV
jgi:hypothetical protein